MAQVTVDVLARVHQRELQRSSRDISAHFQNLGQKAGDDFGQQFAAGFSRGVPDVHREIERINDAVRQIGRDRSGGGFGGLAREIENTSRSIGDGTQNITRSMSTMGQTAAQTFGQIGALAGPIGMGALAVGAGAAASVVASLSQALIILPGAIGGAAAAFGTLQVATNGFGDAIKNIRDPEKFAESIAKLAPNAQTAANSLRGMLPAWDELTRSTQNALFANIGPELEQLSNTFMPTLERMTTGVASAFNGMFAGIADELMNPATVQAIQSTMSNITQFFTALEPATGPLTQAFSQIMQVGSSFLPQIAQGASNAAQSFANFINEASRSGDLQHWLAEGLETVKQLIPIAGEMAKAFLALAPAANDVLPMLKAGLQQVSTTLPPIITAAENLTPLFYAWQNGVDVATGAVDTFKTTFQTISGVVQGVSNVVQPVLEAIRAAIDSAMGPLDELLNLAGRIPGVQAAIGTMQGVAGAYTTPSGPPVGAVPGPTRFGPGSPAPKPGTREWFALSPADRFAAADASRGAPTTGPLPGTYRRRDGSTGYVSPGSIGPSSLGSTPSSIPAPTGASPVSPSSYSTIPNYGGYTSDQALLSKVPAGHYSQTQNADLLKGIGDCSSAVEDLVNVIDGRPTGGRSMSTGNADQWLRDHGFLPGYMPGAFNVGFNDHHMQATLPGGTPFNWGSDSAAARRGIGGTGALDPAFTSHYYRPVEDTYSQLTNSQSTAPMPVSMQEITDSAATQIQPPQIGSGLDNDLGLSRGLPGLLDNLIRFVGSLAAAPVLGPLGAMAQGSGGGYGLAGITGAQQQAMTGSPLGLPGFMPTAVPSLGTQPAFPGAYPQPGMPDGPFGPPTGPAPGPTDYGQQQPQSSWQPAGGGFNGLGGMPMAAASAAASAVPGLGQAAETGMQLANRTIGFGGQVAATLAGGLLETFGLTSAMDPGNSWLGRVVSGFSGARPALPAKAGSPPEQNQQKPQDDPNRTQHGQGGKPGPGVYIEQFVAPDRNNTSIANELAFRSYASGGKR